jgi:L-aminopeptidase/D-esterase-like protein
MPNYCDLGALEGFTCGQASDPVGKTGVTVLRFDAGAVAAVDVRGAAPGDSRNRFVEAGKFDR